MDYRVIAPNDPHAHSADPQFVPIVHDLDLYPSLAERFGAALVADDPNPWAALQQPPQPPSVEMISMLVGVQDRGQPLQPLEPARQRAGVQQDPGLLLLHQQARVPELGQPHDPSSRFATRRPFLPRQRGVGPPVGRGRPGTASQLRCLIAARSRDGFDGHGRDPFGPVRGRRVARCASTSSWASRAVGSARRPNCWPRPSTWSTSASATSSGGTSSTTPSSARRSGAWWPPGSWCPTSWSRPWCTSACPSTTGTSGSSSTASRATSRRPASSWRATTSTR